MDTNLADHSSIHHYSAPILQQAHIGCWTAVVLAGKRPGVDPLCVHFDVATKAQIEVAGEAMLNRVVRSLMDEPRIGQIYILAQDINLLLADPNFRWMENERRIVPVQSGNGISRSILNLLASFKPTWPLLITTADHALLTSETISHFLDESIDCDVAAALVSRTNLLAQHSDAERTWLKFRDDGYTGANIFALNSPAAKSALELWETIERDRRSLWRIAAQFGPWLLIRIALRSFALSDAMDRAGRRLGLVSKAVVLPFAYAGIDVDKLSDHVLAEKILLEREGCV